MGTLTNLTLGGYTAICQTQLQPRFIKSFEIQLSKTKNIPLSGTVDPGSIHIDVKPDALALITTVYW